MNNVLEQSELGREIARRNLEQGSASRRASSSRSVISTNLARSSARMPRSRQTRGELTLAIPSRNAAAAAIGPMYYRSTIERIPADSDFIEATIAALGTWSTDNRSPS